MRSLITIFLLAIFAHLHANETRVAFFGDSITWDGKWVAHVEWWLRQHPQFADAEIVNFGMSSETVSGLTTPDHAGGRFPRPALSERLNRVLEQFKPTLAIICYGMNDGLYLPLDESRMRAFTENMTNTKNAIEKSGARFIVITPPLFSVDDPSKDEKKYDAVLDAYANWLNAQRENNWDVIDMRPGLRANIAAEKARNPKFIFARDKVHPNFYGHTLIANEVARGLATLLKLPAPEKMLPLAPTALRDGAAKLRNGWLAQTGFNHPDIAKNNMPLAPAKNAAANGLDAAKKWADFHGYKREMYAIGDNEGFIVFPKTAAKNNPWFWRTEFFGVEPQGNLALLEKGFHAAYVDVQQLFGAPIALDKMDAFYDFCQREFSLSPKVILKGFSRGGLFAFNWAARNPEKVAGIYVDAPVCDFKSWPAGKGAFKGSPNDWKKCLDAYQMTEAQALQYDKNPVDNLAPLANAKIPLFAIVGDVDEIVPLAENFAIVEERYKKLGGEVTVIHKPDGKHHPHSVKDPQPIVDFAVKAFEKSQE